MRECRANSIRADATLWRLVVLTLAITFSSLGALGQDASADTKSDQQPAESATDPNASETVFEHPATARFWVSGQINVIFQGHPSFPAKYSGPNSLKSEAERATSKVLTLFTGYELTPTTEVIFDVESASGRGISDALGLAGFTNLDVVRNPDLGGAPYVARFMIRKTIPLASDMVEAQRNFLSLPTELPARRLELTIGKGSVVDFFDLNAIGSDSHLQFMNWTVDNSGAYDYAANTRGYTWVAMADYEDRSWAARFAEALMPKVANGINLEADVGRARAENLEVEFRRQLIPHRASTLRLLSYVNHGNMGSYREAIDAFHAGRDPVPDVTKYRRQGRIKYGFGANLEQAVTGQLRAFGRWGWNEGHNESFIYTEVDQTAEFGADLKGDAWRRRLDKVGAAYVVNVLSGDHREYLALGGLGFLLGDGRLTYGRERIFEGYYTLHLWRGVFVSADLQHITNPGYNRDRGPVLVPSLRLHVDF